MKFLKLPRRNESPALELARGQAEAWVALMLKYLHRDSLTDVAQVTSKPAIELEPVPIADVYALTSAERTALRGGFASRHGVVCFTTGTSAARAGSHPLLAMGRQLANDLPTGFPVTHPAESSPAVLAVSTDFDGTAKIFEVADATHDALTSEALPPHFDGTGNAGTVTAFGMYMDSVQMDAPVNYFQNVRMLGLDLAYRDREAFDSLFLPDAITVRWQGLEITRPVFYLNYAEHPQAFFRVNDSDAMVHPRPDTPSLERAFEFLTEHLTPYAPGSSFTRFADVGAGCIVDNRTTIHGRTAFTSSPGEGARRVLARKWWTDRAEYQSHRMCPGTAVNPALAHAFPQLFGPAVIDGTWLKQHRSS
jgi:alpha-ketoglutarate-dependent taurine dioxygenase